MAERRLTCGFQWNEIKTMCFWLRPKVWRRFRAAVKFMAFGQVLTPGQGKIAAHLFSVHQSLAGQEKGDDYQVSKAKLSNIYYMHLQGSSTKCATESRFKFIIRIQIQIYKPQRTSSYPLHCSSALDLKESIFLYFCDKILHRMDFLLFCYHFVFSSQSTAPEVLLPNYWMVTQSPLYLHSLT